jgi:hypothetical protein
VKGWYDEQNLAWAKAPGALVEPSGVIGTVIPAHNLGTLEGQAAFASFVPVAYVALDGTSAAPGALAYYKQKLNLNPVSVLSGAVPFWEPDRLNKFELCFGTQSGCGVTWTSEPLTMRCSSRVFGFPVKRWWVRITAAGESVARYRCVTRRDHTNYSEPIPATTRWRWILGDDTIWTECTQGCCQTETDS